jgi:hypothetical protein
MLHGTSPTSSIWWAGSDYCSVGQLQASFFPGLVHDDLSGFKRRENAIS